MMDARERDAASTGDQCQENSLAEGRRKTVVEGEKPETGTGAVMDFLYGGRGGGGGLARWKEDREGGESRVSGWVPRSSFYIP